jgi:O-antigen/teichoic acid export membrane protein
LLRLTRNRLVRQNIILFAGGLVAGLGGFVYHAIAGRALGDRYGDVAVLVAIYAVGNLPYFILLLIISRFTFQLAHDGRLGGIRFLLERSTRLLTYPALVAIILTALLAIPAAGFLHLRSALPMIPMALALAGVWQLAIPRGALQGLQRFGGLSANLSFELIVRMVLLIALLAAGFAVGGSMVAILGGVLFAYGLGLYSLRDLLRVSTERVQLRTMIGFSLSAAGGMLGVLLLYNVDVVLAKHYLNDHGGSLYGALNKIGTIIYFLTLSVSQVMFPRVVEAVAKNHHPGRLLLLSAGMMTLLGAFALAVFAITPQLVVVVLFPRFPDSQPFLIQVGLIGLGLSLNNLLVQFFLAVHDRWFMPLLGAGCLLEVGLIWAYHATVGEIVLDVLTAIAALFAALFARYLVLLPRLRPEMVAEEGAPAIV